MTATARPGLPVLRTVSEAFHSVPENWQGGLRISWLWLLILAGMFWLEITTFPVAPFPAAGELPAKPTLPSPGIMLLWPLLIVVSMLALGSTAVAWHRLILLGEQPPRIWPGIGRPALRYLGRLLLIGLSAMPVMLLGGLLLFAPLADMLIPQPVKPFVAPSAAHVLAISIVGFVAMVPALLVIARLSVGLPAIAIGRPMTLTESWEFTVGNTGRLFGGTLLVYMPAYAIGQAFQLAFWPPVFWPKSGILSAMVLMFLINCLAAVAALSFLSLSYRFIARTAEPARLEAN